MSVDTGPDSDTAYVTSDERPSVASTDGGNGEGNTAALPLVIPSDTTVTQTVYDQFDYAGETMTVIETGDGRYQCPIHGCGSTLRIDTVESKSVIERLCIHIDQSHSVDHELTRVCPNCDETFERRRPGSEQEYCSVRCYNDSRRPEKDIEQTCTECGDTFTGRPDGEFCSSDCAIEAQRTYQTCPNCTETFHGHEEDTFCSAECNYEYRRVHVSCLTCSDCQNQYWYDVHGHLGAGDATELFCGDCAVVEDE